MFYLSGTEVSPTKRGNNSPHRYGALTEFSTMKNATLRQVKKTAFETAIAMNCTPKQAAAIAAETAKSALRK